MGAFVGGPARARVFGEGAPLHVTISTSASAAADTPTRCIAYSLFRVRRSCNSIAETAFAERSPRFDGSLESVLPRRAKLRQARAIGSVKTQNALMGVTTIPSSPAN